MNWNLVISILTALGIFEIIKKLLSFSFENNLIKRNLEIREIAERVLTWSSWLKLRNFEQSLPPAVANQLYLDIFKIEDIDKELSGDIMRLINYPQMNVFLHESLDKQPQNMDIIRDNCEKCHNMTDKLNKKCNKLRY
jgi:hypothetical protein